MLSLSLSLSLSGNVFSHVFNPRNPPKRMKLYAAGECHQYIHEVSVEQNEHAIQFTKTQVNIGTDMSGCGEKEMLRCCHAKE